MHASTHSHSQSHGEVQHKLKQHDNINIGSCVVSISSCPDYLCIGCLDDSLRIWANKWDHFNKEPIITHSQAISGITDVSFSKNSTHFASLSIDSSIKILDLDTRTVSVIEVPMFSAFKLIFAGDSLVTCGDIGRVLIYDIFSREIVRKLQLGDYFLSAINRNNSQKKILVGNANGDVYIASLESRDDPIHLRPHHKMIRSATYTKDEQSVLTGSDDSTICQTDIAYGKIVHKYEGHLEKVTCVKAHQSNHNIFFSCSSDRSVKIWDIRARNHVFSHTTAGPLLALQPFQKKLLVAGEIGVVHILNIQ